MVVEQIEAPMRPLSPPNAELVVEQTPTREQHDTSVPKSPQTACPKQRRQRKLPEVTREKNSSSVSKSPSTHRIFKQLEEEAKANPNLKRKRAPKPAKAPEAFLFSVDE
jgi:hypothetical protein